MLVEMEVDGADGVELIVGHTFDPREWSGHVASVSPIGLTTSTHLAAMRLHGAPA